MTYKEYFEILAEFILMFGWLPAILIISFWLIECGWNLLHVIIFALMAFIVCFPTSLYIMEKLDETNEHKKRQDNL